ncbi:inositol oxygenase family protein [Streptomyces turgidiscabies]|uniref:HD domain-containing protein n=1 Tax=Streptomyces turgidiscabies (strain Car8) TaxID=698760 RepID=L7F8B3_STRT8|nr:MULTISPECIES: inositol oxygenase family protein [Streptomyces]ELP67271.1 hypothetical protein STRTUCAR8_09353 [Streptomyces turgidiscabies Car8]MDX3491664.1 inositol oxygenase family protein [Streptomyces turgidiscabies]GAQ73271.1 hypothetical protein T45_05029 [Streptomyces turgidiscabies]
MELRGVGELMDLLHACRGTPEHDGGIAGPVDLHQHALQTAALLRRSRPADKELQVAGLVHAIGRLLIPGAPTRHARVAADAVRHLLGERVARLVHDSPHATDLDPRTDADTLSLRQADEAGRVPGFDAGVLEDWCTLLELVAEQHSRLGAVD